MANLDGLREHIRTWADQVVDNALTDTLDQTTEAAPERTGALRQMLHVSGPESGGDLVRGLIWCDAEYAGYTDAGTQPHPIDGNPLLAFEWANGPAGPGFYVFHHVNHPGTTGTQWFNSGEDGGEPMASRWHDALQAAADAAT